MSRIRANQITNQSADGAPTVQNGLVISGVTTSTTFSGSGASLTNIPSAQLTGALPAISGANLTGITQTTINNNGSNRIITGSGTANTLEGESTFIYDGTSVATIDTSQTYATFRLDGNSGGAIEFYENGTRRFELYGIDAEVALYDRDKGAYHTRFKSGGNIELSDGKLLIGTTSAGNSNADDLTVANSGEGGITIRSGSSSNGNIFFSDATSGAGEYAGIIDYKHSSNMMTFGTNGSERVRINSGGSIGVSHDLTGTSNYNRLMLNNPHDGSCWLQMTSTATGTGANTDGLSIGLNTSNIAHIWQRENAKMMFATNGTSRMEISADGQVTKSSQPSFAAYRNVDGYGLNNQIFPFNTTRYNIGGHFNTSNYRFTAPVAGRYLFNFYSIYNTGGSSHQIAYRVNNSTSYGHLIHFSHAGGWDYVSFSQMFNLSANDYVTMWSTSNINWHGNSWQLFCGELLS